MLDPKAIEEMARRFGKSLPTGAAQLGSELEKNVHALVQGALHRMNLVTRDEFEIQRAMLSHMRERMDEMGARIAELEQTTKHHDHTAHSDRAEHE